MGTARQRSDGELVQGTLDMLVLKTLSRGPMHGYGIAQSIQQVSADVLRVEEGSLYPALYRLEHQGLIASEWGESENKRKARFYELTDAGRKRLRVEQEKWSRFSAAVAGVLRTEA